MRENGAALKTEIVIAFPGMARTLIKSENMNEKELMGLPGG